ncbi:TonB-dependent hemoglobin/transferrin/lactoferrin family receptor [Pseudoxanthomonas dokdonensis]|uniref:Sugar transporter n=1 Tax=Pseudoxanthomonas dokdonensis TaxID=344882 RepID=A0A0R0CVH4_9GAMM|nr:TonB-dependent hemoglobin/transferrin/lactoferrin family receptor [Pseudoxanthomonas dokdonensis]KRG70119.1 sugar transporter [Pseudoxanthomonas dokdonensis]
MLRNSVLTTSLWLALASLAHAAPEAAPGGDIDREFDRVQVTATRTERAVIDVANTVDVITREQLDQQLIHDLKDLVRYQPGLSVGAGSGRFSNLGDINIRGLGGNRVLIQTDGINVSDSFSFGSYLNANRNFVDLDTLKQVDIVRGPASASYGSDALGGVVAFVTKDPSDYLEAGKDAYFGLNLGFESDWDGLLGGATMALGGERWSGMVVVNHRQGQETRNQGDNDSVGPLRTRPNPQDISGTSLLSKLVYAPSANQRFKLVLDANEDYGQIDVLNGLTEASGFTSGIDAQTGKDHQTRARVSFVHEVDALDSAMADSLDWQLYRQDSESTQRTDELRSNNTRRQMQHNFDQRLYGLQANLFKSFDGDSVSHELSYGLDASWTDSHEKRDGTSTNLATGAVSNQVGQDVFPVRDFPISQTTRIGLYAQDEIQLAGGRLSLIPGVRVDYYKLDPTLDNIFAEDNPGVPVAGLEETNVSPKFGAIWRFADQWQLFANYARGFRAPPYGDVNVGFTNLQSGYTVIPNQDLKPETSNGYEAGLRYDGSAFFGGLTGYYNEYRDFIESFVLIGTPPQYPWLTFQSQNVADARIYGAELRGGVDFGAMSQALDGWSMRFAAAWSRGDNKTDDTPLNSIDPLRGTLGLAYQGQGWGSELVGNFAGRQKRPADPSYYQPAGYGTLDLLAHWQFAPGARVYAGVFNLTDKKYSEWADVNGVSADSPVLDRYTRPGRSLSVNLALNW